MDDIGDSEERMAGRQHGFSPAMRCFHPLSFRPSTCHPLTPSSSQLTGVESILASHIVADYLRQHSAVIETRCPAIDTLQFRAKNSSSYPACRRTKDATTSQRPQPRTLTLTLPLSTRLHSLDGSQSFRVCECICERGRFYDCAAISHHYIAALQQRHRFHVHSIEQTHVFLSSFQHLIIQL
jgi:hypothetical protein